MLIVAGLLFGVSLFNVYNYLIKQGKYRDATNSLLYFAITTVLLALIVGISQVSVTMDTCSLLLVIPLWWVRWQNFLVAVC